VGNLLDLMEENYARLLCLAPDVHQLTGMHRAPGRGVDLHLDILDQAPYTTLARLTYRFPRDSWSTGQRGSTRREPDAYLRICHDAHQVEVLALRQRALLQAENEPLPTLKAKWRANWFLSKWLAYCVLENHCFVPIGASALETEAVDAEPAL
jgi:uncharacterized protein YqiB (DUF1249 family)